MVRRPVRNTTRFDRTVRLFRELILTQVKINADFADGIETQVSPVTDEQRERLKALGYTN